MARTYKRDARGRFARGGVGARVKNKVKNARNSVRRRRTRRAGNRSLANRTVRHVGRTASTGNTARNRATGDAISAEWAARRKNRKSRRKK